MTTPSDESYLQKQRAACAKYYRSNKDAKNLKSREYYAANKAKIFARKSAYRDENREKLNAYSKKYRLEHKDSVTAYRNEYNKRYSRENRKILNEKAREYREENKTELSERRKLWVAHNPARRAATQRRMSLKKIYRLTVDEWHELLEKQGGICPICKTDNPGGRNWHTDHDHVAGYVRGILCGRCNIMLGHARDSVEILQSAIEYLSVSRKKD